MLPARSTMPHAQPSSSEARPRWVRTGMGANPPQREKGLAEAPTPPAQAGSRARLHPDATDGGHARSDTAPRDVSNACCAGPAHKEGMQGLRRNPTRCRQTSQARRGAPLLRWHTPHQAARESAGHALFAILTEVDFEWACALGAPQLASRTTCDKALFGQSLPHGGKL